MILNSTLVSNQEGFDFFMRKMKGYPAACFRVLNTSFKSLFSRGIMGTRSSMLFSYETLTEITNSKGKGTEAEQLAVVTPQPSRRLVRVRGA